MGDLSGDGLMHTDGVTSLQSEYAKGFNTVFRSKLDALGDEGAIASADGAVSVAKRWINDTNSRGVNTLGGDFGGFFDEFEYPPGGGVKGQKAWAAFYQDMGEDINPDVAKYPDIRGKVMEDFVFKSAGKADASWESSLRTSNNQAKSGISSRDRIDIATVPDLRLPAAPAGFPLPRFTSMPPAGRVVTGNDLKLALDAMKDIRHTYAEVAAGQPISNERAYRNAMTRLARLGYS